MRRSLVRSRGMNSTHTTTQATGNTYQSKDASMSSTRAWNGSSSMQITSSTGGLRVDFDNSNLATATAWTFECAIYPTELISSTQYGVLSSRLVGQYAYVAIQNNRLTLWLGQGSSWNLVGDVAGATTLTTNQWYHVVLQYSNSTGYQTFLNGNRQHNYATTASVSQGFATGIAIGALGGTSSSFTSGARGMWFDNVRLSKTTRYGTTSFTAPTTYTVDANTYLFMDFEGTGTNWSSVAGY